MSDRARILYFYPSLHFDTGSPKAMAQFIDLLDRRIFAPVFCSGGRGPLSEALASRDVEIIPWPHDMFSPARPLHAAKAIYRQARLLKTEKIDLVSMCKLLPLEFRSTTRGGNSWDSGYTARS